MIGVRGKGEYISPFSYYRLIFVPVLLFVCFLSCSVCNESVSASTAARGEDHPLEISPTNHIAAACINKCPEENRTNLEHLNVGCGKDCYMKQCTLGCQLWELALDSSCQIVCNKTDEELLEPKELYCVMGCNDALNRYFKWLRAEIGTPPAPALVADSLTATALSLEWEIPSKLLELTKGKPYIPKSYLVQWRYEEVVGDWKFCRNQSMGDNSTVKVDNLQPYTKYRFRVALPLSPNYDEVLVSEQSVIISTLAMGVPLSEPAIVRAVAVDHTRISVSWEPGPFPNGPILSYVLQIKALSSEGYSAIKNACIWPIFDCNRSRNLVSLKRAAISNVVAVITGHCLIGKHANRMGVTTHDFCRSCLNEEEEENILHFLCQCPALAVRRNRSLGSTFFNDLSELSSVRIRSLEQFIKESKWFEG